MRFCEAHLEVLVGKCVFDSMQPYWVKKMNERNVCCCIYHVEMEKLLSAFTRLKTESGIHDIADCICQCEVCLSESYVEHCVAGVFCISWIGNHFICSVVPKTS